MRHHATHSMLDSRPANAGSALVTGGAGFIGGHLVGELLARGTEVTVVDNLSTGRMSNIQAYLQHPHFHFVHADILDASLLDEIMRGKTIVYHLAAAVGVQFVVEDALSTVETNVMGTGAVLKSAHRHNVKVLVASTSEVYGKCAKLPAAEDDDVLIGASRHSRWSYAASKLVDEFLALAYFRQHGLPVVVFRLFNTVGPRQTGRYGMVIPRFVQAAAAGTALPVHGDGGQSRSFLHVRDAVAGILQLADDPRALGEVFNIGASREITILQLAQKVLGHVGVTGADADAAVEFIPYSEAYAPGFEDIRRRVADTTKLRDLTGWAPRYDLDDIIGDVLADVRQTSALELSPGDMESAAS